MIYLFILRVLPQSIIVPSNIYISTGQHFALLHVSAHIPHIIIPHQIMVKMMSEWITDHSDPDPMPDNISDCSESQQLTAAHSLLAGEPFNPTHKCVSQAVDGDTWRNTTYSTLEYEFIQNLVDLAETICHQHTLHTRGYVKRHCPCAIHTVYKRIHSPCTGTLLSQCNAIKRLQQ